jgi:hypothetical protein
MAPRTHDLGKLAERCAGDFPFYGEPEILSRLNRFSEFAQAARYPWVRQKLGNGFTSLDIPLFWELFLHLRTDLPIKVDDYILGMIVRGHHHNSPEVSTNAFVVAELRGPLLALRTIFPQIDNLVRR